MKISVRDLKSRLSETLRRVAAGDEVAVTSRGTVVARLVPPPRRARAGASETELIARFRRLHWVRPGSGGRPALPKPLVRITRGGKSLAGIVNELRG